MANIVAQRLVVAALALLGLVGFALVAGYPRAMVVGTALAGLGVLLVAVANALLLPLMVGLRNAGLALVEVLRQVATLAGVAVLVLAGAQLTPFFAVQLAVGLLVLAAVPFLVGRGGPSSGRASPGSSNGSFWARRCPVALALALGQIYFRLVIVLMSLISPLPSRPATSAPRCGQWKR